ncbi:MAG: AgmX/PglI C-terminal domain-containing protein, partial [Sandaracinaceae bacterium]|nr:AgmX/PglI C-terminal domain-containing protein [Sandaracinaceae bacterium]
GHDPEPRERTYRYPDATTVTQVIARGRPHLRQCYETATRRVGAPTAQRVRMRVHIAPAGRVSDVEIEGAQLPGMAECLERTASRWSFPASRRGAEAPLSLVFVPGELAQSGS